MDQNANSASAPPPSRTMGGRRPVLVWDLPVRLFHWALVGLVAVSIYTGLVGGLDEMEIHVWSGQAVLVLVLFRIVWGLCGGREARFSAFVRGPGAVFRYLGALVSGRSTPVRGHNPAGGWAVIVMLGLLAVHAGTGLFANDDIFVEGPLYGLVDKQTSDRLTYLHYLTSRALFGLIALHLAAVAFHEARGERLVTAMFSGRKRLDEPGNGDPAPGGNIYLAAALLALAAALVIGAIRLA